MMFWTIVRVAFKSLRANKLRSLLAMLGIIIAVWSVIAALALGAGAQQSVMNKLSALGTNVLVIVPEQRTSGGVSTGTQQTLTIADAEALLSIPEITHVSPVVRGGAQMKYLNKNTNATVMGTAPTYFKIREFKVTHGRILSDADLERTARVAVIGTVTAQNLFGDDYTWCVGETIQVKGVSYRVVGLLESKGDQGWFNPDNQIIIPFTTAMSQVLGLTRLQEINISGASESDLAIVQTKATDLLRKRHRLGEEKPNDFRIHNQAQFISTAATVMTVLSLLLGGIAAISLLVGGIGIMNIMLVTVAERTREIGIRKAIGARERDILRQFLIESVVITSIGGLAGLIGGYATAKVVSAVQDSFVLLVQPVSVILAVGFSLGVGIFFGYYPARRAAKLDPIEALRYE